MKKLLLAIILIMTTHIYAKTVQANSEEINENLNLEAIASLFAEAKDLEDFEMKLNDPKLQISNLDLNEDEQVDYLRVIETTEDTLHVVVIQAVLDEDMYQDVATIEADKLKDEKETIQIVGDSFIYGEDYIVEPVYVERPPIFDFFWMSMVMYHAYHSHYHWGYYPPHFHHWHPRPPYFYRKHIHNHISNHHHYKRTTKRRSPIAKQLHNSIKKNDFALKHPNKSHIKRAEKKPVAKPIQNVKPTFKPAVKPKPAVTSKPHTRPAVKPKPTFKPTVNKKPHVRPARKPRPAVRPKPPVRRPTARPKPPVRPAVRPKPTFKPKPSLRPAIKPRPKLQVRTKI